MCRRVFDCRRAWIDHLRVRVASGCRFAHDISSIQAVRRGPCKLVIADQPDHRQGGVTAFRCVSVHVPCFLTESVPPISDRQLPPLAMIAQAVSTAHSRAKTRAGFLRCPDPKSHAPDPTSGGGSRRLAHRPPGSPSRGAKTTVATHRSNSCSRPATFRTG